MMMILEKDDIAGNKRELLNAMKRAIALCEDVLSSLEDTGKCPDRNWQDALDALSTLTKIGGRKYRKTVHLVSYVDSIHVHGKSEPTAFHHALWREWEFASMYQQALRERLGKVLRHSMHLDGVLYRDGRRDSFDRISKSFKDLQPR